MSGFVPQSKEISAIVDQLCGRFAAREEALVALTDLAVLVAAADGTIDDAEVVALTRSLEAMLRSHVGPSLVRVVVEESRNRMRLRGVQNCAVELGETLARNGTAEDAIRFGFFIAASSEGVSTVERERMEMIAQAAGMSADRFAAIAKSFEPGQGS